MRRFAFAGVIGLGCFLTSLHGNPVPDPNRSDRRAVQSDPVVISDCRLAVIYKQEVSSQRDGQLRFLTAGEIEKGPNGEWQFVDERKRAEKVPAGRGDPIKVRVELRDKQEPPAGRPVITEKNGTEARRYYERYFLELMEGDIIEKEQLLGHLDDRLARADLGIKDAKVASSKADVVASIKTKEEALARWETARRLYAQKAIPLEDFRAAEVTYHRYDSESTSKEKMVDVAREELNQARTVLGMHEIRSEIPGLVRTIYKHKGEAVRSSEPIMQIHSLERLRVEGLMDAQYIDRVRKGMKVSIESPRRLAPRTLKGHLGEITGVAVSNNAKRPLIVSASEDGTARVWDPADPKQPEQMALAHPTGVAVRAVACTPPRVANLCLTGGSDGIGRIWNLDKNGDQQPVKLENGHRGAITCVAFGPDGSWCLTGGEDRPRGNICLWDTATGKIKFTFPTGHPAAITWLQVTDDGHVVSTGRDYTLRVWKPLGEGRYEQLISVPRRSGDVAQLGVNPDGKSVMFDQGKELRIISSRHGRVESSLQPAIGTSAFTTMALFSPDGKVALTAGASEGRLQLWRLPAGGMRGHELVQLITSERAPATCGAFAPSSAFVVTGSKDRSVYVWDMPPKEWLEEKLIAEVVNIEATIETGARHVRIRADIANPDGRRLLVGDSVTMVIYP